jgi:flotillin
MAIVEEKNKLRVRQAQLEALALAEEEEAKVAGVKAKVVAEQSLEQERIELQRKRLEADVVAPARAEREAQELRAKGQAAKIIEDGAAQVQVLQKLTEQFKAAGADAQDIFVLNMLPELVEQITDTVKGIDIDRITVIDSGNGTSGNALPNVVGQMPAAVISITEQIEAATGVNILEALTRDRGNVVQIEESGDSPTLEPVE